MAAVRTVSTSGTFRYETNIGSGAASVPMFWFDAVDSTMDTAKELIRANELENKALPLFGVMSKSQSGGRGTRGRKWLDGYGNLYLTIVLNKSSIPQEVPLTMVPLRIGSLLHPIIRRRVAADASVALKWPNDVLVNENKVSGMLIEIEEEKLLIGIGINVMTAPPVPNESESVNPDSGRASTCIYDQQNSPPQCSADDCAGYQDQIVERIAAEIVTSIGLWVESASDTGSKAVADFSSLMQKSPQKLRNSAGQQGAGAQVTPISVNPDGSLQVRYHETGLEGALYADYLW